MFQTVRIDTSREVNNGHSWTLARHKTNSPGSSDTLKGGGGVTRSEKSIRYGLSRVPTAQEKQRKWHTQNSLSGKTLGILNFSQNTGKSHGILPNQRIFCVLKS